VREAPPAYEAASASCGKKTIANLLTQSLSVASLSGVVEGSEGAAACVTPVPYNYSLVVKGPERQVSWGGPCVSFRVAPHALVANHECLFLPDAQVARLAIGDIDAAEGQEKEGRPRHPLAGLTLRVVLYAA
jgi:hypothetical protein